MSVREQMVALAKLGRIDASTHELDRELKEIPKEIDSLREAVSLLEGLLAKERSDLEQAQTLRTTQETLIKEAQDAISRSKAKGAKAKNAREAEAVERELEASRRTVKERELERDKLGTAIEQVQKSLGQHETEFLGLKEMLTQKEAEGQARMAELNVKRDLALTGRGAIVDLIPKDIVRRYDAFRIRKGSGVAEVREGICLGCRVAVRPQQHIVIQREEAIEQCAQCQRYLYLASWVADDAATLEAGEKSE